MALASGWGSVATQVSSLPLFLFLDACAFQLNVPPPALLPIAFLFISRLALGVFTDGVTSLLSSAKPELKCRFYKIIKSIKKHLQNAFFPLI